MVDPGSTLALGLDGNPAVRIEPGRGRDWATHVRIAEWEGPLGLLLSLIEARRLDILTVPLGGLAESYLEALATIEHDRMTTISSFVAVASQLILIKSRAMLPRQPAATDGAGRTVGFHTDVAGRRVAVTDPLGQHAFVAYTPLNLVATITDAKGGQTAFTYDGNGNLLTLTDPRTAVTTYTYDDLDRVATRTDTLSQTESYQYDANGNLAQVTDRKSQVTTYAYDALDRLTTVTYPGGATVTYTYDVGDRVTSIADSVNGTITRASTLKVGYFAQHQLDELDEDSSPYDHVRRLMPDAPEAKVRGRVGAIGFSGLAGNNAVKNLSGGEKARLLLGLATFTAPQLIILDEPTNHLDIDSRAALIEAINDYPGQRRVTYRSTVEGWVPRAAPPATPSRAA